MKNPNHDLAADFTPEGVALRSGTTRWGLTLTALGYGETLSPVVSATPQATANRVEYRRGLLTEWYANGPLGLEQGFTLAAPPEPCGAGPLTLALILSGNLRAALDPSGESLTLQRADGPPVLRYYGLTASDATGRTLPSWLELRGTRLLLRVDATGARYPLVVDPLIQAAKLTASDGASVDGFGSAVAVSGDTVVVGATDPKLGGNNGLGAAYVFVKPPAGWASMTETAKLSALDGAPNDNFGSAVALSDDTVVVGANHATLGGNGGQGAAYVFVKPPAGWATTAAFTAKLTASDGAADDNFGSAVGLSGDTVVVGAPFAKLGKKSGGQGAAYVFVKPPAGWATMTETAKLTALDGSAYFGFDVAVSGDTAVVGSPLTKGGQGAAYVFVKPPAGWATTSLFTAKLTASDGAAGDYLGAAVAISGDTAVVGSPFARIGANGTQGAAYVFVKPPAGWATTSLFTAKLTASDGAAIDYFGSAVAISGDTVVVGAPNATFTTKPGPGAAYVFVMSPAGWATTSLFTAKLTASDGAAGDYLGAAVAISGDTVVGGAPNATFTTNPGPGAAYVFVTQQNPTLQLHLNQSVFHTGGQLVVNVTATPGPSQVAADVYVAVQLPNGSLLFLRGDGSMTPTLQPLVRNWTVNPFSGQIFSYTFHGLEPAGNYAWLAAFAQPGTLNFIGGIVQAPFSFSP